jgi:hypothetical protein
MVGNLGLYRGLRYLQYLKSSLSSVIPNDARRKMLRLECAIIAPRIGCLSVRAT